MKDKLNFKIILTIGFMLFGYVISLGQVRTTVQQGDYRSKSSGGSWGDPNTWEQYTAKNGGSWRDCLVANIGPPNKSSFVTIIAGSTVFIDDGSQLDEFEDAMQYKGEGRQASYPYEVNTLVIEADGKLLSSTDFNLEAGSNDIVHPFSGLSQTNSYDAGGYTFKVFGKYIQNDGQLGTDGADGIILEMPAPYTAGTTPTPAPGFTIQGNGTTQISKLRMTGGSWPSPPYYAIGPDVPVVIDQNMNVMGAGYAFTCLYKPTAGDNYTLRVNPGKTVTLTNPLGVIHNQSVSNGLASTGGAYLYDILGTLDLSACDGVNTFTKLASTSSVITVNVPSTGVLKIKQALTKSSVSNSTGDVVFLPETNSGVLVLPLDMIAFKAKLISGLKKEVNLDWITVNEVNTKDFIVERSFDGKVFTTIGNVKANNKSGTNNYAFKDLNPGLGVAYYRLKQTDLDGKFTFSKIVSVNNNSDFSLFAYPNPTTDQLSVLHESNTNPSKISVIGLDGRSIMTTFTAPGSNKTALEVSSLKSGLYFILYDNGTAISTLKFIKK
jgi:hypothetical protein